MPPELVQLMAQSGCQSIQFGFESGNEAILRSIGKNTTPKQIEDAARLCLDLGVIPIGNFLVGFPDDTRESIRETLELAKKLKRMGAVCYLAALTPFPGTYIYEHRERLGIVIHSRNWDDFTLDNPVISTRHLSLDELRTIYADTRTELYDSA